MSSFFDRFFGGRPTGSKDEAKSRLKTVLVHDQVGLTPAQMEGMKLELCSDISRYADIDKDHVELRLERINNRLAVVSSFPVRRVLSRPAAI